MFRRVTVLALLVMAACGSRNLDRPGPGAQLIKPTTALDSDGGCPLPPVCDHDVCATGAKLNPECDPCAAEICARDTFCCAEQWNPVCIEEVATICHRACLSLPSPPVRDGGVVTSPLSPPDASISTDSCPHAPCTAGAKMTASCDPCVAKICAADSYCCSKSWSSVCVKEVGTLCGQTCGAPADLGAPMSLPDGGEVAVDLSVGGDGGPSQNRPMLFAVFGDARPPSPNDTANYPSSILGGIFSMAAARGAQFMLGTGDYLFANNADAVTAQAKLFLDARSRYSGPVFLAMGNHECTGYTADNCPTLDETPNIKAFVSWLPAGVSKPYYRFDVDTPNGKAKFVVVAANAWDATQEAWLRLQLADPTAYTFVLRHEPPTNTVAPGAQPSETIIARYPLTLELVGHTHTYRRIDTTHVISGNAGAPLEGTTTYGLLLVEQRANGDISVSSLDVATGTAIDSWAITSRGANAS